MGAITVEVLRNRLLNFNRIEPMNPKIETGAAPSDTAAIIAMASRMSIPPRDYILALVDSFPCLRGKWQGQWDVERFMKYSRPWSTGERHAALFIACVWNPMDAEKRRWRFNVVEAMGCWDNGNRAAFRAWCATPYWP